MALGEAGSLVIGHQRAMVEGGRRQGKGAVEQELARGGDKQIRPANHFGDLHGGVIDHDRQLIGGDAVGPPHDEVAKVAARDELLRTESSVEEGDGFAVGYEETPGEALVG